MKQSERQLGGRCFCPLEPPESLTCLVACRVRKKAGQGRKLWEKLGLHDQRAWEDVCPSGNRASGTSTPELSGVQPSLHTGPIALSGDQRSGQQTYPTPSPSWPCERECQYQQQQQQRHQQQPPTLIQYNLQQQTRVTGLPQYLLVQKLSLIQHQHHPSLSLTHYEHQQMVSLTQYQQHPSLSPIQHRECLPFSLIQCRQPQAVSLSLMLLRT